MNMATISKRSIIAITLILFASLGVFANGAGETVSLAGVNDTYAVAPGVIKDLSVSGVEQLVIKSGAEASVLVEGDKALVGAVEITNEAGYLAIAADDADVKVTVTTPDLDGLMLEATDAVLEGFEMDHDFSLVLADDATLDITGTLEAEDFYAWNHGGNGGQWNIDVDTMVIDSNNGAIVVAGEAASTEAKVTLDGELDMAGLAVQSGALALYNDAVVNGDIRGISSFTVRTSQDAVADLDMNGNVDAAAYGDSSITIAGDIAASRSFEDDDASVSIG